MLRAVAGGGATIGRVVAGGTATRVLFVGAGGVLADDSGFTFNTTGDILTAGLYRSGDGTVSAVAYGFTSAANSGWFSSGGTGLTAAWTGTARFAILGSGADLGPNILGFSATLDGSRDTGVSRVSAGVLGIGTGTAASVAGTVHALTYAAAPGTAITAGGLVTSGFRSTSTANFGVFFGSGAPTISTAKGSLYLRSDGTGAADRAYINTDGGTTWTAIATAG